MDTYVINTKLLLMKHLPVAKHTCISPFWWVEPCVLKSQVQFMK